MRCVKAYTTAAACFALLSGSLALAVEHRWTHFGLRPLGMGNAYVGVADDFNALFYNPAGLARLKSWDLEVFNPALEIASHTVDTIENVSKLGSGDTGDLSEVLALFRSETGHVHHFAGYLTPHFIVKHFGMGLGLDLS